MCFLNTPQVAFSKSYVLITNFMFFRTVLFDIIMRYKPTECSFLNILNFHVLYMFRNREFIFRKTVVYTGKVECVFYMHQYKQSCRSQRNSWKNHPCQTGFGPVAKRRAIQRNLHETLLRITENDIMLVGDFSVKVGSENEGTGLTREKHEWE